MIPSVTNSLAALVELPAAPAEGAGATARPRAVARLLPHAPSGPAATLTGAAKAARPSATSKAKVAPSGAGYAKAAVAAKTTSKSTTTKASSTSTAKKAGPLDFLDNPKLSVEDKLLKLLAYLNDKWNKDLDKKMKEFKTAKTSSSSASGTSGLSSKSSSGLGGLVGKAVGFAKSVFPAAGVALDVLQMPAVRSVISKFSGPALAALATATGFPELAPAALKYGPQIVDAVAGVASSLGSDAPAVLAPATLIGAVAGGSSGSGVTSGASSTTTQAATPLGSGNDDQLKLMEIQRIMDQQKEMFSLTSNLLRSGHDARMAVIQNLRA